MSDSQGYFAFAEGGIVAPEGFLASGVSAGIKKNGKRDVCIMCAESGPVPAASVFTLNSMAAPPIAVSRSHIANGLAQAIIVNSGNANACTGPQGLSDAQSMARAAAAALGCEPDDVLVASTADVSATRQASDVSGASVVRNASMVAMFGMIMPLPLAMPPTL